MADTPHKTRALDPLTPEIPPAWNVRGLSPMKASSAWAVARAQDTHLRGARVIADAHTGGLAAGWTCDADTVDADTWRTMLAVRCRALPGQVWVGRAVVIPAGDAASGGASVPGAEVRAAIDVANGTDDEDGELGADMGASDEDDHAVGSTASWDWLHLEAVYLGRYLPEPPVPLSPAVRSRWSERVDVGASVDVRGAARLLCAVVQERPSHWSVPHDATHVTAHGAGSPVHPVDGPRTSEADGATYEEGRHGTHRMLGVAQAQVARVGPVVATWGSHAEGVTAHDDAEAAPVTVSSSSLTCLWAAGASAWSASLPGLRLPGWGAWRDHEQGTLPRSGVLPVRVHVRYTSTGGRLRVQTTARSWVTVPLPTAAEPAWATVTAFLECDPAPDVPRTNVVLLAAADDGTTSIYGVTIEYAQDVRG